MAEKQNIQELLLVKPDFIGFIFYEQSTRNATDKLDGDLLNNFPADINKVGVFVDASIEFIIHQQKKYSLDFIQLHGSETPAFCATIKALKFKVIKAFSVNEIFDFTTLNDFEPYCEYFLFDTKGKYAGGNGVKFDWNILATNPINKTFFLSGGVELSDIEQIKNLKSQVNNFYALDVNSKFETAPALKNIGQIAVLKNAIEY